VGSETYLRVEIGQARLAVQVRTARAVLASVEGLLAAAGEPRW
jgi:hypothetical protein